MPYPDNFSPTAYAARWDNPSVENDRAEAAFIAGALIKHAHPLMEALYSAEFRDNILNDMCHSLAQAIEDQMMEIKRRGDL